MFSPTVKMFALLSDQGTACGETALCQKCFKQKSNRGYAREVGSQADDITDLKHFHDCSENEALECCICGVNIFGAHTEGD